MGNHMKITCIEFHRNPSTKRRECDDGQRTDWQTAGRQAARRLYRCQRRLLIRSKRNSWPPSIDLSPGLARYISPIYIIHIYRIYIRSKVSDIFDIFDIFNFYRVLKIFFNVTHCDYVLIFSLCVLLAYDLCPQHFLSVGQLLSDFTSPQQCRVYCIF